MSGDASRRTVVAVALTWNGRIGLFKRSAEVGSDVGLWHCITGFVEGSESPIERAAQEILEETGLRVRDLECLDGGPVLRKADADGDVWTIHTFRADSHRKRLRLNGEHVGYRWVRPSRLGCFDGQVSWLRDVVEAVLTRREVPATSESGTASLAASSSRGFFGEDARPGRI